MYARHTDIYFPVRILALMLPLSAATAFAATSLPATAATAIDAATAAADSVTITAAVNAT